MKGICYHVFRCLDCFMVQMSRKFKLIASSKILLHPKRQLKRNGSSFSREKNLLFTDAKASNEMHEYFTGNPLHCTVS